MKQAHFSKSRQAAASWLKTVLSWPLRKLLAYSLEYPALLRNGTRLISYYPPLFNWLLNFAQARGIVMVAEEAEADPDEIQAVSDLSPEGKAVFDALKAGFSKHPGAKP